jgi:hypothetical protein
MDAPQRTRWILSLAAAAVVVVVLVVSLLGRRGPAPPPAEHATAPAPAVAPAPPLPIPPPPQPALRRAELALAADRAAAAYAAGQPYADENRKLVGRRFEVVIPFGCRGPGRSDEINPARWRLDARRKTITLTAEPQVWTKTDWVVETAEAAEAEAVEGFWIPRPWLWTEVCPAAEPAAAAPEGEAAEPAESAAGAKPAAEAKPPARTKADAAGAAEAASPPPATPPTLGLVQVFGPQASRTGLRGARPYRVVRKAGDDQLAGTPPGFRLVLHGRISGFASGEAIRCHSDSMDRRPACLVGVQLDRVRFEDQTGGLLAEWTE